MSARGLPVTIAVFTSGAVLLGVELAASRVLAPYFGNSLFVWGALIGVVLSGLAIGYWLGGVVADRVPSPLLLVGVIAAGAASILAIPFLDEHVLEFVVSWDPGPRADPVVAAILLFGLPSVLLAGVTPIAVRLRAREVDTVGATAGRLFSISTVGSIVGTFATAFWLIPELGTDQLLGYCAAALFGGALVACLAQRQLLVSAGLAAAAAGAAAVAATTLAPDIGGTLSATAARNWSPAYRIHERLTSASSERPEYAGYKIVYQKDTRYHRLAVVEDGITRTLRFGSSFQSAMNIADPFKTEYRYTDFLGLGFAYRSQVRSMLIIGLGGASAPKRLWRDHPGLQLDVVELDPVVVDVARRWFKLPTDPRLSIHTGDGRRFLAETNRRWDVIALDAYFEDGIPFHLTTREFVEQARERLAPGGVILMNVIGAVRGDGSKLFRAIYRTYRTAFPTVVVHPVDDPSGEAYQNLILVATDQPAPAESVLLRRWNERRAENPTSPDLTRAIRDSYSLPVRIDDVPTLTDDYAPTDALLLE
jgi:spermidine synthase